jgi:tetratricopeptide (TPR) repeat protein
MTGMNQELQKEINFGKELLKAKKYDKAEEVLLRIVKKHQLADVYNALGLVYADQGKFNFAEIAFQKALKINPQYMEAALNLSVIYNNLGLAKKSKEIYKTLQKYGAKSRGAVDPLLMAKLSNLNAEIGDLYHSVGEYKEAVEAYERAVDLCPHFIDIQTKLATAYRESGQSAKALKIFQKYKSKAARFSPFWISMGVTYYAKNKNKEAQAAWKKALQIEPSNKTALAYSKLASGPAAKATTKKKKK